MKAAPLFQVPFHLVACIEANLLNSGEKLMQAGVVFESRKIPVVPQAGFLIYIYPPTPAFAKAGAAPGTTAGVELVFLSNRHPKATSMASSGRPSLPFATP